MNLLVIKDNKPGHYNQSEGIALSLQHLYNNLQVEYIEVEIKNKFMRTALKYILNYCKSFSANKKNLKYLKYFFSKFSIPKNRPDLIISTGGNTANINAWFANTYKTKNLFNGRLRGQKETLFTCITTVIPLGYKNEIVIDVAPSIITKESLENGANTFSEKHNLDKNYYTLLIGGNGAGYEYDDDFYSTLIKFVKTIAQKDNVKWLITTSRRTPINIENTLQNELNEVCSYFVAYNSKPQKVLTSFLGISKKIFVTEDSSSMISEAITSRKAVFTIYNKETKDKNYNKILNKFEHHKKIKRIKLSEKVNLDINFNIPNEEYINLLALQIEKGLKNE